LFLLSLFKYKTNKNQSLIFADGTPPPILQQVIPFEHRLQRVVVFVVSSLKQVALQLVQLISLNAD